MEDQFIRSLRKLTPTEKEIRKASPEALLDYIEKVFELSNKEALRIKKEIMDTEDKQKNLLDLEIQYGIWSNKFNTTLRQIIKETELFDTPKMKNLCTRLNLLLLIWTKNTRFFQNTIGTRVAPVDVVFRGAHEKNEAMELFRALGLGDSGIKGSEAGNGLKKKF